MSITFQYISYRKKNQVRQNVVFSDFSMPESLDAYDVTIIDFYDTNIWRCDKDTVKTINCIQDIRNIKTMLNGSNHTKTLVLFPCNTIFYYNKLADRFFSEIELKNNIPTFRQIIGQDLLPVPYNTFPEVLFENTKTQVGDDLIPANFYFDSPIFEALSHSNGSDKTTTCRIREDIIISSLVFNAPEKAISFAEQLFFPQILEQPPEWMASISFGSDQEQHRIIEEKDAEIKQCQLQIALAQAKLDKNDYYKSILYTTGDQLVEVVYDMLQRMLECDLSEFVDVKNEDFRIKKEKVTFIGEIKGVGTNVKNDNISQVDRHCMLYLDELQEKGIQENPKQLLIINPLRNKQPEEREPISENQMKLALRNKCLIIKTEVLLRIFEAFQDGNISSQQIEDCFANNNGELSLDMVLHTELQ